MPYIYSNRGLSVRWEDESYVLNADETASAVFVPPPDPPSSSPSSSAPFEVRLAEVEARLEQFLKIATGITGTLPPR